jgi:lipid-binding SYLF domain-containing protein
MSDEAVDYLDQSNGWEIGAGPSVTVGDNGMSKKVSTTTMKSDIHAVVFHQQGLMAGMGVEGNKITRIKW